MLFLSSFIFLNLYHSLSNFLLKILLFICIFFNCGYHSTFKKSSLLLLLELKVKSSWHIYIFFFFKRPLPHDSKTLKNKKAQWTKLAFRNIFYVFYSTKVSHTFWNIRKMYSCDILIFTIRTLNLLHIYKVFFKS